MLFMFSVAFDYFLLVKKDRCCAHSLSCSSSSSSSSTGQRAVMPCDWGVKADMVLFAGNTV